MTIPFDRRPLMRARSLRNALDGRRVTETRTVYALMGTLALASAALQAWLAVGGEPRAMVTAAIVALVGVVALVAASLSAGGKSRAATLLLAGSLVVLAVAVTLLHRDPGVAVTLPIIAFVLALPYLRGPSLLLGCGVGLVAIAIVLRASAVARSVSPANLAVDVVFGGIAAGVMLMILTWHLVRSRERLVERMTRFVEGVPVGIFKADATGRLLEVNEAMVRLLGYPSHAALLAVSATDLLHRPPGEGGALGGAIERAGTAVGELELRRHDGFPVWVRYHIRTEVGPDERITGYEGAIEDVSSERTAREATARLAAWKQERAEILDALRRLAPGRTVEATADAICAEIATGGGLTYAALLELHNGASATVVAAWSHGRRQAAGPPISQRFAMEIRRHALAGPWVEDVLARRSEPGFRRFAGVGLRQVALVPIEVGGELVGLLLAGTTRDDLDLEERLHTLGEFATHASALIGPVLRTRHVREDLRDRIRETIDTVAFKPVFQPIVDLESGAVLGYEALTRFGDGTAPDRMFEDARSCDMGVPLEVATIVAALDAAGPLPANRFIDLNVSPELVMEEEPLRTHLRQRGFNIVLEITEHTAIEDYPALRAAFASLGDNVQVAVDDAGAGYASLRHITELRPQFVKLDRELIRGIDGDLIRQALITGMVHFSDGVGSLLIAEGVETEDERATLLALGVKAAQGYLFARPQSAELVPK